MTLPQKADRLKKPSNALAIMPRTALITRVGRQAYDVMLFIAADQASVDPNKETFSAPLSSVIKGFEGDMRGSTSLKRHLKSMLTHVVEWQSPTDAENSESEWGACTLLAEVKVYKQKGDVWISWGYAPSLRKEMLNPSRYAQLRKATIAKFRTHAGLALYEICAKFKDNPSGLTSRQAWQWWLPVLTGRPVGPSIKTEFRFFNRDVIKPAVEEVNKFSELQIHCIEHRVGRQVHYLQFGVSMKQEEFNKVVAPVNLEDVLLAEKLGVDPELAEEMYLKHGEERFGKCVKRLQSRLSLPGGQKIISKNAYFKALLSGKEVDQSLPLSEVQQQLRLPLATLGKVAVNEATERLDSSNAKAGERVREVRTEIEELDIDTRNQLLAELKISLIERNALPAVLKRLNDGNWQSGLVMGELIRFYWRKSRGTELPS